MPLGPWESRTLICHTSNFLILLYKILILSVTSIVLTSILLQINLISKLGCFSIAHFTFYRQDGVLVCVYSVVDFRYTYTFTHTDAKCSYHICPNKGTVLEQVRKKLLKGVLAIFSLIAPYVRLGRFRRQENVVRWLAPSNIF